MKKKDIITVVICAIVIVVCIFFIYNSFFKKSGPSASQTNQSVQTMDFTGNINDAAIQELKNRNDYVKLPMDRIGRPNPFDKF